MCKFYDEKSKLWKNNNSPKLNNRNLGKEILDSLRVHGSKVLQLNDDTNVHTTFHEMWLSTIRIAQNLQKRGFESRQPFSFMSSINDHLIPAYLASIYLACPIVPLHSMLSNREIVNILEKTKPVVLFCDMNSYNALKEILKDLPWDMKVFTFVDHTDGTESFNHLLIETGEEENFKPVQIDLGNDIAGIFGSSGTTGPSKCVIVKFGHSVYTEPDIYEPDSVVLRFDSIFWTCGLKYILECVYNGSTRIITAKPYTAELQFQLIEKYKVTIISVVPFCLTSCLKNDLIKKTDFSTVKKIYAHGGKVPPSLIADINRYFPNSELISSYGLTEIGVVSECILDAQNGFREQIANGVMIKIIDENGNRCGPNESGEICVKKRYAFPGYLGDPEATAKSLDKDGFFLTGDVGHFDENGVLCIGDRKKNTIDTFYFNAVIMPFEMEDSIIQMQGVHEVCVVGIPTASGGELPAAVIVRKPNVNLCKRNVFNLIAENFSNPSKLRGGVYFVDCLPKTHNGKLIRKEITKIATEMFQKIKDTDPEIQLFISDIPEEFRMFI